MSFDSLRRVKLDTKDLASYSLFPGQIVLVEGIGSSGRAFVAKKIVEGIPRPLPLSAPSKLLEYHHNHAHYQSAQVIYKSNLLYLYLHFWHTSYGLLGYLLRRTKQLL
jgi:hypothetical protein